MERVLAPCCVVQLETRSRGKQEDQEGTARKEGQVGSRRIGLSRKIRQDKFCQRHIKYGIYSWKRGICG